MKDTRIKKGLILALILLFICVSFQPSIAEKTVSVEKESDYKNVDFEQAKEYLFQTLIDISNNPEVKQFLNEYKHSLIPRNYNNYDCKNAIQKICSQNLRLLKSILFIKPELTYYYLDKSYKRGIECAKIFGEEQTLEIIDSVSVSNPDLLNELKNIIKNDEEMSNRISTLEIMNNDLKTNSPFLKFPIICVFLVSIAVLFSINILIIYGIWNVFNKLGFDFPIINILLESIYYFYGGILALIDAIGYMIFGCWGYTP